MYVYTHTYSSWAVLRAPTAPMKSQVPASARPAYTDIIIHTHMQTYMKHTHIHAQYIHESDRSHIHPQIYIDTHTYTPTRVHNQTEHRDNARCVYVASLSVSYTYIHIYIYAHTYTRAYTYTLCIYIHKVCAWALCTYIRTLIARGLCVYTYTHTHTRINVRELCVIYIHACIHPCTHTYTHTYSLLQLKCSLLHLEGPLITISDVNLLGLFSTERGKRDLEN